MEEKEREGKKGTKRERIGRKENGGRVREGKRRKGRGVIMGEV